MQTQPIAAEGLLLFLSSGLIAMLFFLRTAQKVLEKCEPNSRMMAPAKVWFTLIPIFGLIWEFFVVLNLTKSMQNEFGKRGIPRPEEDLGKGFGLAMCICNCFMPFRYIGSFAGLVGLVLWIAYWVKIARYSSILDARPPVIATSPSI